MRMRHVGRRFVVAALAAATLTAGGYALEARERSTEVAGALGPGTVEVRLEIDKSRFQPERIVVRPMTEVRFVVVNHDPIAHELIIGPPEVHERHAHGTEPEHPPIPGEVSVAPGETGTTTYRFDEAGVVDFACHLPGHVAHGMVGQVVVTSR